MDKKTLEGFKFIVFLIAFMWVLQIINLAISNQLNQFALVPRSYPHLHGIITMHFLHWNFYHIIANTLPLLALGFLVSVLGKVKQVTIIVILISGVLVWLLARNGVHAGASGLIMGYWGYLLSSAVFERKMKNILIAIFTIIIYGGMVFSLLDFRTSTSFEGHIFGFISGILSAGILRRK